MEVMPRRRIEYRGVHFDEMDLEAILERKPQIVLVDELAHTNIEGSKNLKRWQDVQDILDAKIDVLSTINVQHIETVAPTVQRITGVEIRETVPELGDPAGRRGCNGRSHAGGASNPHACRGDIYPSARVERALSNFFRPRQPHRTS